MLVINPDDCIDCGVCVPECPAEAIMADTEPDLTDWLALNARYAALWPNVTLKRDQLIDAATFDGEIDKLEKYFSSEAGRGD